MLWQKRGTRALIGHRFKRIFLPLLLACCTLIPLNIVLHVWVRTAGAEVAVKDSMAADIEVRAEDVWLAAARGDAEQLRQWQSAGVWMDAATADASTPLAGAFLFGRPEAVDVLLSAEADLQKANKRGERAIEMLQAPREITALVGGMVGVDVQWSDVTEGRKSIVASLPEVVASEADSLREQSLVDEAQQAKSSDADKQEDDFQAGSQWLGHLWFLSFLLWLVAGFVVVATIGSKLGIAAISERIVLGPFGWLWMIPAVALLQAAMPDQDGMIGPVLSANLIPDPIALGYYAVFFGWETPFVQFCLQSESSPGGNSGRQDHQRDRPEAQAARHPDQHVEEAVARWSRGGF